MTIIKETPDYVVIDWHGDGRRSKENKYSCIGGPFNGQKKSYTQVSYPKFCNKTIAESYVGYNCADNPRWVKPKFPKKVWVHKSLL